MKKHFSTILLFFVLFIGLSLLLYPTFSNRWNSMHQSRAISTYSEAVATMNNEEYDKFWSAAWEYNRSLVARPNDYLLSEEQRKNYNALLDIGQNGIMGYIEIPKINITLPVYHGTSEAVLQVAVGHLEWTSLPVGGEGSHCVVSGHRGLPSARLFTDLDKMEEGDTFLLRVLDEVLTYEVDQIKIVEPQVTEDLLIVEGKDYCTLVTCTPYGINSHRMLVRGHRIETPADAVFQNVSADAFQIAPLVVAPLLAVPVVIALLVWLVIGGEGSESKRKKMMKSLQAKKKGGDEHEKMDR